MRSRKRHESVLVVCICLGLLLTLFTANGHPFQARDGGIGIKDDPAENQPLSLSERDTSQQEGDALNQHSSIPPQARKNLTGGISTTISTNLPVTSYVAGLKVLNSSSLTKKLNSVGQTTALPKRSVSIIATTSIRTGSLHLTSIRNSVNTKLNPSLTINASLNSFNGTHLSTSTNSLRNLTSQPPTGNHSSQKNSKTIHVLRVASTATPSLVSHVLNTALSTKVLTQSSIAVRMNPSKSTLIVKATTEASSTLKTNVQAKLTSSAKMQNLPSSKVAPPLPVLPSASVKSSLSGVTSAKAPYSDVVPSQTALNYPSSSVVVTTKNLPGMPSAQQSLKTPPTIGKSEVSSAGSATVPSTHTAPEVSTVNTKQSTQTSKPPSTKTTTVQSTNGPVSSLPPTTEVTVPLSTSKTPSTKKTSTTEVTTTEKTRKPTTQAKVETTTKHSSAASSSSGVPSTGPEEPTKPETTKKITPKVVIRTEKTTAEDTKTKNENNDEGRIPPPNKGREAVLWDFIVPVGIGTGAALAIAFGVILVRACRRRRLVKVRFGGKPSHPRLLNNDLINLLAESDDEEEE